MKINVIDREDAVALFEKYLENNSIPNEMFDKLDSNYLKLRNDLLYLEKQAEIEAGQHDSYKIDLLFALKLYPYFNTCDWFNETLAGNYGFWRYISLNVVPDLIQKRCGFNAPYFYEKTTRMYIPKLWWYVHMSFQNDIESTKKILMPLNTDYIMQLVERTGRSGFYLEISREIMRQLSLLPQKIINEKINGSNLFRRVLIQNTAKMDNYNLVVENNAKEYVHSLFRSCKVRVEDYEQN